jgi:hypothetical protein
MAASGGKNNVLRVCDLDHVVLQRMGRLNGSPTAQSPCRETRLGAKHKVLKLS